ncbi:MAG: hypothetical protein GXP42_02455 [Chloroflexi bacterium]|nr:hypothetical protein [Chloroflexota bacterium]
MSVQITLEASHRKSVQTVTQALESYEARLQASIQRTRRRLAAFEERYGISTSRFLKEMTAEDLAGGDMEYVEWAGEAKLLHGLENELRELRDVRVQLS